MDRKVVVFDFDGTLIKGDSIKLIAIWIIQKNPARIFLLIPSIVAFPLWLLKIISTKRFKEIYLIVLFGIPKSKLLNITKEYWTKYFEKQSNSEVLLRLQSRQKQNFNVIIATGSFDFIVQDLLLKLGITNFTTNTKLFLGFYLIDGLNCIQNEKVVRLKKLLGKDLLEIEEVYTDSSQDQPLLDMSKLRFRVTKGKITSW